MKIHVTARDIRNGIPNTTQKCPIARAIRRRVLWRKNVIVGASARISTKYYILPPIAKKFIKKFDNTREGEPFQFELKRLAHP